MSPFAATSVTRAVVILAVAGAAAACTVKNGEHPLVRAFRAAEPVTPVWNPDISPPELMWTQRVELTRGAVTVSARCCVGEGFVAQFPDEASPRTVFMPGDYVYPSELRVGEHVVYGRASGKAGGITNVTRIFAYDLNRRAMVETIEVEAGLLPPARAPASPRPGKNEQ